MLIERGFENNQLTIIFPDFNQLMNYLSINYLSVRNAFKSLI